MAIRVLCAVLIGILAAVPAAVGQVPKVPLTDLGEGFYLGQFKGGLYRNGTNVAPADHQLVGMARSAQIQPLNPAGQPSPTGKYVLLSIGGTNANKEFCGANGNGQGPCSPDSFMARAAADPQINHTTLAIIDGSLNGGTSDKWLSPGSASYRSVQQRLAAAGLSERQVQVVWLKTVSSNPSQVRLPAPNADAFFFLGELGQIARALKVHYPNLRMVFLSSRIYGGYSLDPRKGEPYAYEMGFSTKWLIGAQIRQMRWGLIDPLAGDLNYNTVASWLVWGPYLWADGRNPRSDGLTWEFADFDSQEHVWPSASGVRKVSDQLLVFFKTSPLAAGWFLMRNPR